MARTGSGISIIGDAIRLRFTWQGKRCCETLDQKATPANLKYAARLVEEIKRKISVGAFEYGEYFPNSKNARLSPGSRTTLRTMADMWLETKGRLADATLSQYKNALAFWCEKFGPDTPIDELTHGKIAAAVGSHPWPSAKLCNNYLIPLRGTFALAGREIPSLGKPLEGISNAKHQQQTPDPLTVAEMEKIIADLRKHYNPQIANYFEFAFMTGMRPEELIALQWGDIDWNHRTIKVERVKTFKGTMKDLKTHSVRNVDLVGRAIEVLLLQKQYTFMKSPEIFENPNTMRPWHDERSQRDHYWRPSLKRLGIRSRRPYQTRHTYATTALMAGANPAYISRQMGHNSPKMLFSVYSKWIDGADNGRERAKMEATLARSNGTDLVQKPDYTGRHDWTRTNPPEPATPHKDAAS